MADTYGKKVLKLKWCIDKTYQKGSICNDNDRCTCTYNLSTHSSERFWYTEQIRHDHIMVKIENKFYFNRGGNNVLQFGVACNVKVTLYTLLAKFPFDLRIEFRQINLDFQIISVRCIISWTYFLCQVANINCELSRSS